MVKVQKQHKAGPNILSPSPIPHSILCDCSWEGKHPFTVSEMGFLSAAMAVPSTGVLSFSLYFFPPPSLCCHIWNPVPHLFMWSVVFLFSKALF